MINISQKPTNWKEASLLFLPAYIFKQKKRRVRGECLNVVDRFPHSDGDSII